MPKISEKIAFHLPTGASMLRRGPVCSDGGNSPPPAPPLMIKRQRNYLQYYSRKGHGTVIQTENALRGEIFIPHEEGIERSEIEIRRVQRLSFSSLKKLVRKFCRNKNAQLRQTLSQFQSQLKFPGHLQYLRSLILYQTLL